MFANDPRLLLLSPGDTVFVLRDAVEAGELIVVEGRAVQIGERLGLGHKIARAAVANGDRVIKYGAPIGRATQAIAVGDHVHTHNLASDYTATHTLQAAQAAFDAGRA